MKKIRKKIAVASFAILFFVAISPTASGDSSSAKGGDPTLSTSASFNPVSGVNMTVTYELNGQITPASGTSGESTQWEVQLTGGTINVSGSASVSVMGYDVVDESFDVSQEVSLGSEVEIPVALGGAIKVPVKTTATVQNISVTEGKAQTNTSSLDFNSEGSKTFTVTISDNASLGDTIRVSGVEVVPEVQVGLEASVDYVVGTWEKDIAKQTIGVSKMSPTLEGSTTVKSPGEEGEAGEGLPVSPTVIGGIVVAIVVIAGVAYAAKS